MKSFRALTPALAGLVAVCALSSACSSGSSPGPAAGGAAQTAGAGAGGPKATCKQLTSADIQPLMTSPIAGDDVTPVGTDSDGQQCIFHDADSEQAVDVIVAPASDEVFSYDAAKKGAVNPVDLAGVGDRAYREDDSPTAEGAGLMCTVSLGAGDEVPGVDALIVNGSLNLTDAQNAVIAAALGTVCNRIFGSGNTTVDLSGLGS